jgi:hypothetical protein
MRRATIVVALTLASALGIGAPALADAGGEPALPSNCIGTANSGGAQGGFASGEATTLPPGELGAVTSDVLGGPHGLIGLVASSNDCG